MNASTFNPFPLQSTNLSQLDPKVAKLYLSAKKLDERLSGLWKECFDERYQFKNDKSIDEIVKTSKQIQETTQELKNLLISSIEETDNETASNIAINILFREIQYLEDLCAASTAQYEEIRNLKSPPNPNQFNPIEPDLKNEVQNLAFCPPESRRKRFKEIISHQYEIQTIVGDGRCGLRAIVRDINPELFQQREDVLEGQLADALRQSVVNHMSRHRAAYEAFCRSNPVDRNQNIASFEEYLELIGRPGTYIDEQEIEAASREIRRPIWVFNINAIEVDEHNQIRPNQNYRYGAEFEGEPVCLIRIGEHFDLLKKRRLT